MKRFLLFPILLILWMVDLNAQQPIVVQTLTFDSITTRRGQWLFPEESKEYRKVLMYYTLKCDPATTQDNFPCGEWDYLTYNHIWEHTGIMDSNLIEHDLIKVNGQGWDSVKFTTNPVFEYYQYYHFNSVVDSFLNSSDFTVGAGATTSDMPFGASTERSVVQYLWRANELQASGLQPGDIHRIKMDVSQLGSSMKNLMIRMKMSNANDLSEIDLGGFQTVFFQHKGLDSVGVNSIELLSGFSWDSVSSIIMEFSFDTDGSGSDNWVRADQTGFASTAYQSENNQFININNNQFVDLPLEGYDFGDEITISVWTYGDPALMPSNTSIFEAVDRDNDRSLNVHLPWSNSQVYWDAGEGSGYDRINKSANVSALEGQWNHWAFTKNASTGDMKIYLNGQLWHSGTGFNRSIGEIARFWLGTNKNLNYPYKGMVDEFRVWDVELDQATIEGWMNRSVDATHPNWSDLVVYYDFNDGQSIDDQSSNSNDAILSFPPDFGNYIGDYVNPSFSTMIDSVRPQITFSQGDFYRHIDTIVSVDTVLAPAIGILQFDVDDRWFIIDDETVGWQEGWYYTYGPNGNPVDSIWVAGGTTEQNAIISYYDEPYEIVNRWEVGRFITPYGIGLDLGPEGFTWIYDVTEYQWLLHDTVDFSAGNQQELIDVRFEMYEGTPPRDIKQVDRPWGQRGSKSYANLDNDVSLSAEQITAHPEAETFVLKATLSGHGHNSNTGSYPHCCEWKDNAHSVYVDGGLADEWHIWQTHECAQNPVYPQGGTWLGSREGWCPGDVVKEHDIELTPFITSNTFTLDYDITDVPANNLGMGNGSYQVAMQLFQYGPANHELDAEIYDIISPSDWEYYSRMNPICNDARVVLRNNGAQTITTADIYYGTSGGSTHHLAWTGTLASFESEEVTLPIPSESFWGGDTSQTFWVTVIKPNGQYDDYDVNDQMETHFELPEVYTEDLILNYKTNNLPQENFWTLKNLNDSVIKERQIHVANVVYRDTLSLPDGCYTFEFWDTENDGLSYWAYPQQGNGYLLLRNIDNTLAVNFEQEFGRRHFYTFFKGDIPEAELPPTSITPVPEELELIVYPNPNFGYFTVTVNGKGGDLSIELYDLMGRIALRDDQLAADNYTNLYDVSDLPSGIYTLRIQNGSEVRSELIEIICEDR